ncbi:MAG: response regulator [Actinomycetota bacterium]|nr:response regulator [Actinomycetota bacterium]
MKNKILIVEDEALGALGLSDLFDKWGYEVCGSAYSGARAIWLDEECRPDLITMDVRIKGEIDGIETARRIRAKKFVPIIFLSGYLREGVKEEVGIPDGVEFLNKPVNEEILRETVEKLLNNTKHTGQA